MHVTLQALQKVVKETAENTVRETTARKLAGMVQT